MTVGRRVVEQAIGEHLDGTPLDSPKEITNARAGGNARAKSLSAKRRSLHPTAAQQSPLTTLTPELLAHRQKKAICQFLLLFLKV